MGGTKKEPAVASPQAKLAAVIKSARDAMRKDAGLNGDLDRIPQLAWLLFLKAFDGLERNREITEPKYRPAIEQPYRWRDWAEDPNGSTGEALLKFVNGDLLPYLRSLTGTGAHDPRDVLAAVFKETHNRMLSGYLLRDVVNKVNEINFASSDDIHTMAHLYESMLKDMRDAAGDSGEFYTPRPVIRFMVQQIAPKLGEVILDPACGTGGFLVEALEELEPTVQTTQQRRKLHASLRGIEKKPLPYLLGMMNLVLHGVGQPNIVRGNALNRPITQISKADRVDVVLTNPPFGGEEEKSIQTNFPADKQTAETAWLFLQLVIRQLKDGGRCGIVVPNGILFGDGVGARIKQQLLADCNLHTVVRLPDGVFEPYTPIPSNLLFFEKTGRTKEVWFYEVPPPEGRKKYTKTKPMRFEEFAECQAWWGDRVENERAWRVPIADIEENGFNLDFRNPNRAEDLTHRPPSELLAEVADTERTVLERLEQLREALKDGLARAAFLGATSVASRPELGWRHARLGDVMAIASNSVTVEPHETYPNVGIYSFGRGLFEKPPIDGRNTSAKALNRVQAGQFIYSRLFAFEGAYGFVSAEFDGYFVSNEFPTFDPDPAALEARWLASYFRSPDRWAELAGSSKGLGVRRQRVPVEAVLAYEVWLPPLDQQRRMVQLIEAIDEVIAIRAGVEPALLSLPAAVLNEAFNVDEGTSIRR
ncbi:MAG TPA: N-6 DNA methylase [Egibacteraceae bacterium]|nr:N-6 DNA methylase [Egibacteraceae bacterium]